MVSSDAKVSEGFQSQLPTVDNLNVEEQSISELGEKLSDMVLYRPSAAASNPTHPSLPEDIEAMCGKLISVYEQVMAEVAV